MKKVILTILSILMFAVTLPAQTGSITSTYTDLAAAKCKTVELDEEGAGYYRGECAGVGGYKLEVVEGDIRQSINVIAPNGKVSELEFWSKVSPAFSSVGDKAEWRVKKTGAAVNPFALIVRYNTNESEDTERITSRLVVVKLAAEGACITYIVGPVADANIRARELADLSSGKPCKSGQEQEDDSTSDADESLDDPGPSDLIVADVADYEKTETPVWKTFSTTAELEEAREEKESYTIAYVWKKDGYTAQVNFTYFSESGDWVEYWFHTYRADGSLVKTDHELRTFMDDIIVNRIYTFDEKGELINETKTFRDLGTKKLIPAKEYMDVEVGQLYMTVKQLPFSGMLDSGSVGDKNEAAFIPAGWKQENLITGDLNGDSIADSVLQITKEDPEDDENNRRLIILFKNGAGAFRVAAKADNVLLCVYCGGAKGGIPDIEIKNGVILISQMSGSNTFTMYLHRFRYEPSSGKFLLIGEDISENDGLSGESESTSTNYLTGKQIITKTRYDEKKDKDVVLSTRTVKIEMKKKYIEDVAL